MRILIIRHAEPDYAKDSLTEKGILEAKALAEYAEELKIDDCYVSPLGRAQKTASYTLDKLGKKAETKDWLQEFISYVDLRKYKDMEEAYHKHVETEESHHRHAVWDILPAYFAKHPEFLEKEDWTNVDIVRFSDTKEHYDQVMKELDRLIESYGYKRDGSIYRVEKSSEKTIALFCHLGVGFAMLSHLMNVSPFALWQGACMVPSAVTEIVTEEREQGTASFRVLRMGDTSHLAKAGLKASFMGRYCETFDSPEMH